VTSDYHTGGDLIDIRYLILLWLKWSWLIAVCGLIGAYYGLGDAEEFVPTYEASMIVMPESGSVQISEAVAQVSSVLGISVGGASESRTFDRLKVMVGSVALAEQLQERHSMMQIVFSDIWNAQDQSWVRPSDEVWEDRFWFRRLLDLPVPQWQPPDLESLADYLKGAVTFDKEPGTQFVKVSVEHQNPDLALFLITTVYEAADDALRLQDREESRLRRSYVKDQLARANLIDSKQSLIGLLTNEERRATLLESDLPYAARVIEPPFVSNRPKAQVLSRTIGIPAAVGLLIGLIVVTMVGLFVKGSQTREATKGAPMEKKESKTRMLLRWRRRIG